jgi:hypothetical protein
MANREKERAMKMAVSFYVEERGEPISKHVFDEAAPLPVPGDRVYIERQWRVVKARAFNFGEVEDGSAVSVKIHLE